MDEFYSTEVDGREMCGIALISNELYEFVDPSTHDEYAKYRQPRTGEVVVHSSQLNDLLARGVFGMARAMIPADQWVLFRTEYTAGSERSMGEWLELFEEVCDMDAPAYFVGGET